jgi:CDP-6-deoxy-D-xylo-4-hexulose-3-dehydrase
MTDLQGALGATQIDKLPNFIQKRRENWTILKKLSLELESDFFLPEEEAESKPSWYGFALTIKPNSKVERGGLLRYLADRKIGTRLLFAGDLTSQPSFKNKPYRVLGDLNNTKQIMHNSFWIGCWPGLGQEELEFMISTIKKYVQKYSKS